MDPVALLTSTQTTSERSTAALRSSYQRLLLTQFGQVQEQPRTAMPLCRLMLLVTLLQQAPAGSSNAPAASGAAAAHTTAEEVTVGDSGRAPRGRMALLEKTLEDENVTRAALVREEHEVKLQLFREYHESVLKERQHLLS
ncbi:hypothetical protein V5799_014444 [Amblyomma americanum]|uniref:Uncharacterized protein n=1 Tax=Amblyomma americanum TaxID=6943 RepID=A0AAQ4E306_AMBAM